MDMKKIYFAFILLAPLKVFGSTNAYDYEAINATSGAAIGFSSSKTAPTNGPRPTSVFITVEDNDIRFRVDGTDPTTTEGHKLTTASSGMTITGADNIRKFKAIGISGTGDLKVTYER
jgi:hypothetical protein